ncbi:MAG: methionine adenosyltransferase [Chloroflexi bacterium]|nr:methionine adenosyltransferase [Chloroflexota bacterium]
MVEIRVECLDCPAVADQPVEIVERKGIGHPDSICDGIAEQAAVRLAQEYRRRLGRVLHFNLDKGLLAAGAVRRWFGGGTIQSPMRFIFGDRATFEWQGVRIPVTEIVEDAARDWLRTNLPRIVPGRDIIFQAELREGAPELQRTVPPDRIPAPANDTSAAVGYAPLSPTEHLVLATERFLNGPDFKTGFPDTGEDVKVMAFRVEDQLRLTIAMPFLAEWVTSENQYFRRKEEAARALMAYLDGLPERPAHLDVALNTLDAPGVAEAGVYLSLLGTSAENGDSGEVGRGNRVNGVISLNRPSSAEAAAGKNPVSHVGKLYNVLSFRLARQIQQEIPGLRDVYVWLGSQIGQPVNDPAVVAVHVVHARGCRPSVLRGRIAAIVQRELAEIESLTEALIAGTVRIYA